MKKRGIPGGWLPNKSNFIRECKKYKVKDLAKKYNVCVEKIFDWKKLFGVSHGRAKPRDITWYVGNNGCWICSSHKPNVSSGYPVRGNGIHIAKIMYENRCGKIKNNLWVLHRCDNRLCINPDHLFLGSHRDNIYDMMFKDRNAFGICHPNHKLSKKKILWCISKRNIGWTYVMLSKKLKIHRVTISKAIRGKTWKQTMRQ